MASELGQIKSRSPKNSVGLKHHCLFLGHLRELNRSWIEHEYTEIDRFDL